MPKKLHLHLESLSAKSSHMHLTPEVWESAAARHPELAAKLDVTFGWDGKDFAKHAGSADILFGSDFPRERLSDVAPKLKWINVPAAGTENFMPFDWLPEGIAFTNNSGNHHQRAIEFGAMALMALHNRLPEVVTNQRNRDWNRIFSTVASDKVVVILGFGSLGSGVGKAAKMFGMHVIGVTRSGRPSEFADEMYRTAALRDHLPRADFLVVASPVTPETRGLIGAAELDLMKPGAGVVNIGRAPIMDYGALRERLESGHIGGAILDVFDPEPLAVDSPLWTTPNLIVTPHNSTDDVEQYIPRTIDMFFANLARFIDGKPLENQVDRELGYWVRE
ncbi:MAG: D-2-hydroxyacid dehydrogenase [Alphaproteobacteria bacterium]